MRYGLSRFLMIGVAIFSMPIVLNSQKFHFGASAGIVASQIDGDNLRGFNKYGYQVGLLGGCSLNARNWIAVELRHATFGSVKRNEQATARVAVDLQSIDVLFAYSRRVGDAWDGQQKFRFLVGPRIHRVINAKSELVEKDDLSTFFISAHFGISHLISRSLLIDLTYTHGLMDILDTEFQGVSKLQPYYLSLGLSYYLSY